MKKTPKQKKMSRQQMFNVMVRHLRRQGKRAVNAQGY